MFGFADDGSSGTTASLTVSRSRRGWTSSTMLGCFGVRQQDFVLLEFGSNAHNCESDRARTRRWRSLSFSCRRRAAPQSAGGDVRGPSRAPAQCARNSTSQRRSSAEPDGVKPSRLFADEAVPCGNPAPVVACHDHHDGITKARTPRFFFKSNLSWSSHYLSETTCVSGGLIFCLTLGLTTRSRSGSDKPDPRVEHYPPWSRRIKTRKDNQYGQQIFTPALKQMSPG